MCRPAQVRQCSADSHNKISRACTSVDKSCCELSPLQSQSMVFFFVMAAWTHQHQICNVLFEHATKIPSQPCYYLDMACLHPPTGTRLTASVTSTKRISDNNGDSSPSCLAHKLANNISPSCYGTCSEHELACERLLVPGPSQTPYAPAPSAACPPAAPTSSASPGLQMHKPSSYRQVMRFCEDAGEASWQVTGAA